MDIFSTFVYKTLTCTCEEAARYHEYSKHDQRSEGRPSSTQGVETPDGQEVGRELQEGGEGEGDVEGLDKVAHQQGVGVKQARDGSPGK